MKYSRSIVAGLSSLVTLLCMATIAWHTGALQIAAYEVRCLLSGDIELLSKKPASFWETVPAILSIVALDQMATIALLCLVKSALGKPRGQHLIAEAVVSNPALSWFFLVPIAEEVYARWFLLGFLPSHFAIASGKTAFYILFFFGNATWALAHLDNYRSKQDRQWLRVLPQFVGGILLTYAFVKYGLAITILIHLLSNATVFALSKSDDLIVADACLLIFHLACCLFSGFAMDNSFVGVLTWLVGQSGEVMPGWDFDDYTLLFVFVRSFPEVVFTLLGYDRYGTTTRGGKSIHAFWTTVLMAPFRTSVIFCLLWLTDHGLRNVPLGVLVAGITYISPHQQSSGSTSARMFYTFLLTAYPCYRIIDASGAKYLHVYLLMEILLTVPRGVLAYRLHRSGT